MITATLTTVAWHGDPKLKIEVLERLRQHRDEDTIVQGVYQEYAPELAVEYRGCAIGCTLPRQVLSDSEIETPNSGWHGEVERLYGIPRPIGHLIDRTFEGLPTYEAGDFAVAVIEAVPVGADLALVSSRLMLDILADAENGVLQYAKAGSQAHTAIETVIDLYRRRLGGDEPGRDEWKKAAAAADDAAADAAAAADDAAAYDAAAYAAYAADALHAADAAAAADACKARWKWIASQLIHHLAGA